jgi:hypothetical protein
MRGDLVRSYIDTAHTAAEEAAKVVGRMLCVVLGSTAASIAIHRPCGRALRSRYPAQLGRAERGGTHRPAAAPNLKR